MANYEGNLLASLEAKVSLWVLLGDSCSPYVVSASNPFFPLSYSPDNQVSEVLLLIVKN